MSLTKVLVNLGSAPVMVQFAVWVTCKNGISGVVPGHPGCGAEVTILQCTVAVSAPQPA